MVGTIKRWRVRFGDMLSACKTDCMIIWKGSDDALIGMRLTWASGGKERRLVRSKRWQKGCSAASIVSGLGRLRAGGAEFPVSAVCSSGENEKHLDSAKDVVGRNR